MDIATIERNEQASKRLELYYLNEIDKAKLLYEALPEHAEQLGELIKSYRKMIINIKKWGLTHG